MGAPASELALVAVGDGTCAAVDEGAGLLGGEEAGEGEAVARLDDWSEGAGAVVASLNSSPTGWPSVSGCSVVVGAAVAGAAAAIVALAASIPSVAWPDSSSSALRWSCDVPLEARAAGLVIGVPTGTGVVVWLPVSTLIGVGGEGWLRLPTSVVGSMVAPPPAGRSSMVPGSTWGVRTMDV